MACAAVCFSSCVHQELDVFGKISGVVKDAQTSQTLDGVKVTITSTGASQITTSDGQFMFENLDAIEYTLTFEKTGYLTATQTVKVLAGETMSVHVQMYQNLLGIEVSPAFLDFGTKENSLNLTLRASGGKSVQFNASSLDGWLSVTPQSGSVSLNSNTILQVMVSRVGAPGSYNGMVTIRVNSESITVPVSMKIAGAAEPVVTVESISEVTQTTAKVGGLLTLEDGAQVSDYGFCYGLNSTPTTNDTKASRGASSKSTAFECQLSGLESGKEYYVRAYAIADGTTYYGNTKSFTTQTQGGGGGGGTEDYSSAQIKSTNDNLTVGLLSCKRMPSDRIKMEITIKNNGVQQNNDFRIQPVGSSYTWDGKTYSTAIYDDFATSYNYNSLKMSVDGIDYGSSLSTSLPVGATKKFTFTIQDVPLDAKRISLHLTCMFYGYPVEYAFITLDNVPIY